MPIDYSIIIPAYNEEDYLAKTLTALEDAMSHIERSSEIIVVDNNSNDRTAEIAKQHNTQVVFEAINQISRARNAGARLAQGRYLIFVDADTHLQTGLLTRTLQLMADDAIVGGGARLYPDRQRSEHQVRI